VAAETEWRSVVEVGQAYEAELICLKLREAGIEARVLDETSTPIPVPSIRSFEAVSVMVPAERWEEARRILSESQALPEDAESGEEPS
jgi:hypothetical protein